MYSLDPVISENTLEKLQLVLLDQDLCKTVEVHRALEEYDHSEE